MSAARDTIRRTGLAGESRWALALRREGGFMLVETILAMAIFAIVAVGTIDMLSSSESITALSKQKTLAEQGVSNQIEDIRAMDYSVVGTANGNPSGSIASPVVFQGLNGETLGVPAKMTTTVTYASANVPGVAATGTDEKKVVVTITRTTDSKVLAQAVTYVAPKVQASQTTGIVQPVVTDIGNNQAMQNVRVTLTPPTGLSPAIPNGPESDVTDPSGTVTFAGLTPTSGSQLYTVAIASTDLPALYTQLPTAGFGLAPTQILPASIQIYQPVTLLVALQNPDGTNFVGTANITVTAGSGGASYTFSNVAFTSAGTPYTITTLSPPSGQLLMPNIDYSITVQANGYTSVTDHAVVPPAGSYPATVAATLTNTFTEVMTPLTAPAGELDVTVQMKKTSSPTSTLTCKNATVVVSGGPKGALYTNYTGTTGAAGQAAAFPNPPDTYILSNVAPYLTTPYVVKATATSGATLTNSNVTVQALPTKTALTINVGNTTASSC